jgi:hypothetical protein
MSTMLKARVYRVFLVVSWLAFCPPAARSNAASPATSPAGRKTRLVFSLDQGFGNGIVVNADRAGTRRICRAVKSLRPAYEVCLLLNPQVADKRSFDTVLDVLVAEGVPFVFDVYSSDSQTLGTSTAWNAPADGPHGISITIEALAAYRTKYPRHLAGLRFMEIFAEDFTNRAIRTTNPEWNTAGWKLADDAFFQPAMARPFLKFARDHALFVQWSDWHWSRFAPWDAPLKQQEDTFVGLLSEFPGLVTVTYANNEPHSASSPRLKNWQEAVQPFVRSGARDIGLSDQAWMRDPEVSCPPEELVTWALQAVRLGCRYLQFEPVWYFFKLPRPSGGREIYTDSPAWRDSGAALPAFEQLRSALQNVAHSRPAR